MILVDGQREIDITMLVDVGHRACDLPNIAIIRNQMPLKVGASPVDKAQYLWTFVPHSNRSEAEEL